MDNHRYSIFALSSYSVCLFFSFLTTAIKLRTCLLLQHCGVLFFSCGDVVCVRGDEPQSAHRQDVEIGLFAYESDTVGLDYHGLNGDMADTGLRYARGLLLLFVLEAMTFDLPVSDRSFVSM